MDKLTPMMQQYMNLKEKYQDCILFFRLGDFYEMFFEDAITASKVLQIALTSRDAKKGNKAPMCGVPYHAADAYLTKLVRSGYKVAVCEQITDPKQSKGIVERDVVRVVTPGTITDESILIKNRNNYLVSIYIDKSTVGVAYNDFTTGEFKLSQFEFTLESLLNELNRLQPVEILYSDKLSQKHALYLQERLINKNSCSFTAVNAKKYNYQKAIELLTDHFEVNSLSAFGCDNMDTAVAAAGALFHYLIDTQKDNVQHIEKLSSYALGDYMILDSSTRNNLELVATIKDHSTKGSLLWVLDQTVTAMGGRLIRNWITQPLIKEDEILLRQAAVAELVENYILTQQLRAELKEIYDLERLTGKVCLGSASPQDLISLKSSLGIIPNTRELLSNCSGTLFSDYYANIDTLEDIYNIIDAAIASEPGTLKTGEIIKDGYSKEIDSLREITKNGKQWIVNYEAEQREKTGIKSLKVRFNKVFGYYIEVTKSNLENVPLEYQRKQTLANCERYITEELNSYEEQIMGAEERLHQEQLSEFKKITAYISDARDRIQRSAKLLAALDAISSLAFLAIKNNYCQPEIANSGDIKIKDARHPVLELMEPNNYVPNSVDLNSSEFFQIITGPNMAGKSTYARTIALITIMTQIGSFVPAEYAVIDIRDRIFARVGAADDLTTGQSTFMVEMNEVANILNNATNKSLIILDEVGRGTSTFDGLSIAWAISQYIHDHIKAKTVFATHYHELTALESRLSGVKNYSVLVKEDSGEITFLRKIVSGGTDKSYGIHVAKLAGLPAQVINTANKILSDLEGSQLATTEVAAARDDAAQFDIVENLYAEIIDEVTSVDMVNMTPLEAINYLYKLQQQCKEIKGENNNG